MGQYVTWSALIRACTSPSSSLGRHDKMRSMIKEMSHLRLCVTFAGALAVGGCVSPVPQAELDAYRTAFAAARSANDAFLEQYSGVERAVIGEDPLEKFDPAHAVYYASVGQPPLTRQISRAFAAVANYNDLLTILAEGRSWDGIRPQVERTANSFSEVAGLFGQQGAAAGVAIKLGGELFNQLGSALRSVTDRQQAQKLITDHTDDVTAVIDALIEISPGLYKEMTHSMFEAQANAVVAGNEAEDKALTAKIKTVKALLANWVVLLQDTRGALENLKTAAIEGSLNGADLADIAFWSQEVSNHAVAVKASALALAEKL